MASYTSDDGSKCPICFEIYKEPKALACLHTFCETCIHEYILKSKEKGLLCDGIECPLCRFVTHVEKDQPPEKWAISLRSNYALASLLESASCSLKSLHQGEKFCQPCFSQNVTNSATVFCSVCNERMCDECKKVHDSLQLTKKHEPVNIESRENVEFFTTFQTFQRCEQHGKRLKFYCKDEDKLCCSTCAIIAHRECKGLVEINEIANDKCYSIECSILSKQISELENTMKSSAEHFVNESKKLTSQATELKNSLKELRVKVNQRFDELEDSLEGDIKAVQTAKAPEVMVNAVECDEIGCEMRRLLHILKLAEENGTAEHVFVIMKKLKDEVARQKYKVFQKFVEVESLNLSLNISQTMEDFLNKSTKILSLTVGSQMEVLPGCVAKTFALLADINLQQDASEACEPWYRGIGFLNDGRIVAVDTHNNKCVILDENLKKLGEFILPVSPFNLFITDGNNVIITTGVGKKLCLYQVNETNTLIEKDIITVTHNLDTLSIANTTKFVVSTYGDTVPAHELSLSGEVTDLSIDFKGKTFASGKFFKCCYNEETKQLLITDKEANAVYVHSLVEGEMITVKHESLVKPRAISHYINDVYFVCSSGTNSVVQFTSYGKVLAVNKIDMILPHSVCVSPDKDKLLVSNSQKGLKKLALFKIQ